MLIVAFVLASATFAAPPVPDTIACDEVCEAVLTEGLDWALAKIQEDGWDRLADDPREFILNLHLSTSGHDSLYHARTAENDVLARLASSRRLPVATEEHPFTACRESRDSEACRALTGTFAFSVFDVEVADPETATVKVSMSVIGGPSVMGWVLTVDKLEGDWEVVDATIYVIS